jgi:putative membrane protein
VQAETVPSADVTGRLIGEDEVDGGEVEMATIAVWHGWWFFPFFWIGWILILAFLFGGRWLWWRRYPLDPRQGSGQQVLAERFARGEIEEDEYRRRLAVLKERKG